MNRCATLVKQHVDSVASALPALGSAAAAAAATPQVRRSFDDYNFDTLLQKPFKLVVYIGPSNRMKLILKEIMHIFNRNVLKLYDIIFY